MVLYLEAQDIHKQHDKIVLIKDLSKISTVSGYKQFSSKQFICSMALFGGENKK